MTGESSGRSGSNGGLELGPRSGYEEWYRFGVIVFFFHLAFLLVLLWLLQVDLVLGLAFAFVGGLFGALAVLWYVFYWRERGDTSDDEGSNDFE